MGGKGSQCDWLTAVTTFMCGLSGNLGVSNLLEPSGSVQACRGVAFHVAMNKLRTTGLILQIFC